MSGSYRHVTDSKGNFDGMDCIDHLGDAEGAITECVWMIKYLAGDNLAKIFEAHRAYVAAPDGYNNPEFAKTMNSTCFWERR